MEEGPRRETKQKGFGEGKGPWPTGKERGTRAQRQVDKSASPPPPSPSPRTKLVCYSGLRTPSPPGPPDSCCPDSALPDPILLRLQGPPSFGYLWGL